MTERYQVTLHKGRITDAEMGWTLNTRIETVEGIETLERAHAIADTYERNGYTVGVYQTEPFDFFGMMHNLRAA